MIREYKFVSNSNGVNFNRSTDNSGGVQKGVSNSNGVNFNADYQYKPHNHLVSNSNGVNFNFRREVAKARGDMFQTPTE